MTRLLKVEKKKRRERPWRRWAVLAAAALLVAALLIALHAVRERQAADDAAEIEAAARPDERVTLSDRSEDEVVSVTVTLRGGTGWTMARDGAGWTVTSGGETFPADAAVARAVFYAGGFVEAQEKLADDFESLGETEAAFGLDPARAEVSVAYADGGVFSFRFGDRFADEDAKFYFMRVQGDPALYTLDAGTAEDLALEPALLRELAQPGLYAARIDRIMVETAAGIRAWELDGEITDADAADRWLLTQPLRYPAEGEAVSKLKQNLTNIRMGGYVAEATAENRAAYGIDAPTAVMTVHMGAGTTLVTEADGAVREQDWPEETVTLTVGQPKNDMVDYVCWRDSICTVSHFLVRAVTETDPAATLTRYPVRVSLSNLRALTVARDGETRRYELTRAASQGEEAAEPAVTLDGAPYEYAAFESRYNRLLLATVSGRLPDGWAGTEAEAHTRLTFETETGVTHTVALSGFDALHDAVWVDGAAVFYLVKGGLALDGDGASSP